MSYTCYVTLNEVFCARNPTLKQPETRTWKQGHFFHLPYLIFLVQASSDSLERVSVHYFMPNKIYPHWKSKFKFHPAVFLLLCPSVLFSLPHHLLTPHSTTKICILNIPPSFIQCYKEWWKPCMTAICHLHICSIALKTNGFELVIFLSFW